MKELLKNAMQGFLMALADSVPGVSGGTVAFVLGFYDKFINSLNTLISRKGDKKEAIKFLVKLGCGWVIGMAIASLILSNLFETHIYQVSSLFIGFTIFAIPLIIKEEKENVKGKYKNLIFTIIGIVVVSAITYFNPQTGSGANIDITNFNLGLALYVFAAGMIAISAMILPGISGSTLLLIFGLYMPIITGIKETLHFNLSYLGKVGIEGVESNLGTAIRTIVVLIMAWIVVFVTKKQTEIKNIDKKSWKFLIFSGLTTGLSWLCYYKALQDGQASIVVPIDKLSILVTIAFSYFYLKEKLNKRSVIGLIGIVTGTLLLLIK